MSVQLGLVIDWCPVHSVRFLDRIDWPLGGPAEGFYSLIATSQVKFLGRDTTTKWFEWTFTVWSVFVTFALYNSVCDKEPKLEIGLPQRISVCTTPIVGLIYIYIIGELYRHLLNCLYYLVSHQSAVFLTPFL